MSVASWQREPVPELTIGQARDGAGLSFGAFGGCTDWIGVLSSIDWAHFGSAKICLPRVVLGKRRLPPILRERI